MHCPMYHSNVLHQHEFQTNHMRTHLEPLFLHFRVNLVVAGHVHCYERTAPLYQDTMRPDGIVYITM